MRGFKRLALVAIGAPVAVVLVNLALAAHAHFFASYEGRDLVSALRAERDGTLGFYDARRLSKAREAGIVRPRLYLDPSLATASNGDGPGEEAQDRSAEVLEFASFTARDLRREAAQPPLEIAAIVGVAGAMLSVGILVLGWVIAGFFT